MSAFVVSENHINLIASLPVCPPKDAVVESWMCETTAGAIKREILDYYQERGEPIPEHYRSALEESADYTRLFPVVADILLEQNVRSVLYRYDGDQSMMPRYVYAYRPRTSPVTCVEALKALDCYEYQSCETPDWEQTLAYRIVQHLRDFVIQSLPGYDEAPWEW